MTDGELVKFKEGECFLLHVFWPTPDEAAAEELLAGLRKCGVATERDTPCVPTYFFRRCHHPSGPSPAASEVVWVELTELYLDGQAFFGHATSSDFLEGYGIVMQPKLMASPARTLRVGQPTAFIIENVLKPVLREEEQPLVENAFLWNPPSAAPSAATFLSLDLAGQLTVLPRELDASQLTTAVAFPHPLQPDTTRFMCVFPSLPSVELLTALAAMGTVLRGQFNTAPTFDLALRQALQSSSLAGAPIVVQSCAASGFILHPLAAQLSS